MADDYVDRVLKYSDTTIWVDEAPVDVLWEKRGDFAISHKKNRIMECYKTFLEVTTKLNDGYTYTFDEAKKSAYWEYIKGYHRYWRRGDSTGRAVRQMYRKFRSGVRLFHDIKKNGMRDPLDMVEEKGKIHLYRGCRRLVILKTIGTERAKVRYAIVHNSSGT